jgi:transposase-like protein
MARKRYSAEQIIHMLRQAEIKLVAGKITGKVARDLGISEQTYYRWRKSYGGMQISQAKKLKGLASDMLAIAPEFGLRIYQQHFGPDFQSFTQNGSTFESH